MVAAAPALLCDEAWAELAPPKPPTPQQQFEALKNKADAGDATAQYQMATLYVKGALGQKKNDVKAAQWMTKAATAGLAPAQYDLAGFYRLGRGVNPDFATALGWYIKAADQGRDEAVSFVCDTYTQTPAVAQDWAKAFPYCQKAATAGSLNALYAVGYAYTYGKGVTADPAQGLQNLQRAADKGQGEALGALGQVYFDGKLAPQDYGQSLILFRKAVRQGNMAAVAGLARQYDQGLGTAASPDDAARLYGILAQRGDVDAKAWLTAHPKAAAPEVLTLDKIPRDIMFYAVDSADPRFQTMDIHGYFDELSESSYPADAQNNGISGSAIAECRFTALGDLGDCVLVQESPRSVGFGLSIMRIMDRLSESGNKTDWMKRYAGKVLRVQVTWKIK